MASGDRAGDVRASVWLAGKTAPRRRTGAAGDGAALDLPRILATTVRLLDAEGLAKFSMRRLATELGVTAMSVYWYVDNKDDLLELALDEANADMAVPDVSDESVDWREHLRRLALEYRKSLVVHPWVAQLVGRYLNIGPHSMAFADATLSVMRRSGLPQEDVTGALSALFQFVYGFSTIEALHQEHCRAAGVSMDEYYQQVARALAAREEFTASYQESAEVLQAQQDVSVSERREREFAFALETVIAGIEAMRDRKPGDRDR
ncbi:TetR/AcrR family transcriptional regulator [Streptomyces stramineus]|uniref:TetR/AcrR family transcriptional regulator n=1 Tax=Streptomyces stramineus TaxID=173861 RepID=A0ABN1BJW1_9ACTN